MIAALLFAVGVAHLGMQIADERPWTGPLSWRKPATFGVSFGLTLATVTWVSQYTGLTPPRRATLLRVFAAASVGEVAVITTQAWRGVPSHFNTATTLDAALAYTAAAGGAVLFATTGVLTVAPLRGRRGVAPSIRLAVRAGLLTLAGALAVGALMIARGVAASRTGSLSDAYAAAAELKWAHGALMHGVLVLPAVAEAVGRTAWTERRRWLVVAVTCLAYLGAAAVVVVLSP